VGLQGAGLDRLRVSRKRLAHIPRTYLRHNNGRASADSAPLYLKEVPRRRTRTDDEIIKWVISAPAKPTSILPFLCGDLTLTPSTCSDLLQPAKTIFMTGSNAPGFQRASLGIAHISFAAGEKDISVMIVEQPVSRTTTEVKWRLSTLNGERAPALVLTTPSDREQEHSVEESRSAPGTYEVGFSVGEDGREGNVTTPFGRIVWVAGGQKRE
jgi:hypothetical protein